MTDEDIQAVADRNAALLQHLAATPYERCRASLDRAIENIDYFKQPSALSLGGMRHWVTQAQNELDQMRKVLAAAEAASIGGKQ